MLFDLVSHACHTACFKAETFYFGFNIRNLRNIGCPNFQAVINKVLFLHVQRFLSFDDESLQILFSENEAAVCRAAQVVICFNPADDLEGLSIGGLSVLVIDAQLYLIADHFGVRLGSVGRKRFIALVVMFQIVIKVYLIPALGAFCVR